MTILPNFIIIGAMKAGTTSLYHYLSTHPDVSVSSIKETDFFLGRQEYQRGLSWYSSLFEGGASAIGEASPNYTKRHFWPGVPERIAQTIPNVRLIYVVRDPIDRIVSNWVHNYAKGRTNKSLSEAAMASQGMLKTSMYAYQLDAFLDYFPRERILVVDSADLRKETARTLRDVFAFIGTAADYEVPNLHEQFHVSAEKMRPSFVSRHVKHPLLRRALRRILPAGLTQPRPFERPKLSSDDRARLADVLRTDVERFRTLTGLSFTHWSV